MDGASKATLENEFGTHNEDDILIKILEKGEMQASDVRIILREASDQSLLNSSSLQAGPRQGSTNDSKGARAGH
jgi:ribosome maturation protein Sdo1